MSDQNHLFLLKEGIVFWNHWKQHNPETAIHLHKANLSQVNLSGADLRNVDLSEANLEETNFYKADLSNANLSGANLNGASFIHANLSNVNLTNARLIAARFNSANLTNANLSAALLDGASFLRTNLQNATLSNCEIYGISVWDIHLENTIQTNLVITPPHQAKITVDNLKVAQFIYLLLNNHEVRDAIDTVARKVVLILGRFTQSRITTLNTIREALRQHNYLPVLFDFDKPGSRDLTETISTLAHISRFILADLTDASSIPQELSRIIPQLPSVPIQPLLQGQQKPYALFEHFQRFPWVLPIYYYSDTDDLLAALKDRLLGTIEQEVQKQKPAP